MNVLFLSDKFKDLLKFTESTVAVIIESLTFHRRNTQLNAVGLMAIENILRSGKYYYLNYLVSVCSVPVIYTLFDYCSYIPVLSLSFKPYFIYCI